MPETQGCPHQKTGKCPPCKNIDQLKAEQNELYRSIAELKDLRDYAKEERRFAEARVREILADICPACKARWTQKQES